MSKTAIRAENVSKSFGREQVLKNVNISLDTGSITGIVGRNGSGKTVLMKCILGFLAPTTGQVYVFDKRIGKDCDFAPRTGMIIETPGFLSGETGQNNLLWLGRLSGGVSRKRVDEVIEQCGLDPKLKKSVSKYSLGMRQRLGLAQALLSNPDLLILDEPMNGLDKLGVLDMRALLLAQKVEGKTILLASHFAQDIDELCDRVLEMDQGILTELGQ